MNVTYKSSAHDGSNIELEGDSTGAFQNQGKLDPVNDHPSLGAAADATDGCSVSHFVSANSNNATSVKASAGRLYGVIANNINAAARYLKFYNKASAPTPASETPILVVALPPASNQFIEITAGVNFSLGIALALVTGIGDTDNTSVAASEHTVTVIYK
jgi:hypothetical protein